jgi:hypothetical protein
MNKTIKLPFELITKEQFDAAYNQHLPSGWIKFAYKYFSKETEEGNMEVKNTVVWTLGGLFIAGLIATMLNLSDKIVGWFVIPYCILLAVLVLYLFSAVFLNNFRINKIRKILGVTKEEYNALVSKFYS